MCPSLLQHRHSPSSLLLLILDSLAYYSSFIQVIAVLRTIGSQSILSQVTGVIIQGEYELCISLSFFSQFKRYNVRSANSFRLSLVCQSQEQYPLYKLSSQWPTIAIYSLRERATLRQPFLTKLSQPYPSTLRIN